MQALTVLLTDVLPHVLSVAVQTVSDQRPEDEEVTAGWTAFVLFLLLIAAVAFLGFSLTKHLRKAKAAQDAGVYGDTQDEPRDDQAGFPRP